jgi:hypothetical protein
MSMIELECIIVVLITIVISFIEQVPILILDSPNNFPSLSFDPLIASTKVLFLKTIL